MTRADLAAKAYAATAARSAIEALDAALDGDLRRAGDLVRVADVARSRSIAAAETASIMIDMTTINETMVAATRAITAAQTGRMPGQEEAPSAEGNRPLWPATEACHAPAVPVARCSARRGCGDREGVVMAIHPRQVRLAFGEDPQTPATPAKVIRSVGDHVELLGLDGVAVTVTVVDPGAFEAALQRDDLCRLLDRPLALVNERRHVLALAIGPPGPPNRLEVQWGVSILAGGSVVEIPSPDEDVQPAWRLFELRAEPDGGSAEDRG